jgi:hypothetical protein
MLDITTLSVIMTIGAEKMDSLPPLIVKPDIVRRVQRDNYVQMEAYKVPEAKNFLKGLLTTWIDAAKRDAIQPDLPLSELGNDYDPDLYPLTVSAYEPLQFAVVDHARQSPVRSSPGSTTYAAEAYLKRSDSSQPTHTELGIRMTSKGK